MQTPTQTERQALDAAIAKVCGSTPTDPIVLHDMEAPPGAMKWHAGCSCSGWFGGQHWHRFQRSYGNEYGYIWFGEEVMVDQHGRVWGREFDAVIDDFGNLVEVPQ